MVNPRLSVIIPTVNREALLCDTLRGVLAEDYRDREIIVVDQSEQHDPETARVLRLLAGQIRYHRHTPPNLPAARNVGLRLASGSVIVFFDDDVGLPSGILASVAGHFARPEVAGVGGFISSPYESDDKKFGSFARYVRNPQVLRRPGLIPVDHFFGGFMSFRRDVFASVGGFDEWIGTQPTAAAEDLEFCMRVRRAGFGLYLDTTLTVSNLGGSRAKGGCEKGSLPREVVLAHQMKLLLYAHLKNRVQGDPLVWWRSIVPAYRSFVLNREVIYAGGGMLVSRHILFAKALRAACQAVTQRPYSATEEVAF